MNVNKRIHDAKFATWVSRLQQQAESGLPVKQWCQENGVTKNAYYYWKRLIKETYADSVVPEIVPLYSEEPTSIESATPIPLLPEPQQTPNKPELHNSRESRELRNLQTNTVTVSSNNISIDIYASASNELVAKIIEVIRNA